MEGRIDNRQRIVAALAVLRDGDEAADVLSYMDDHDRAACAQLIETYAEEADCEHRMQQLIMQMVASERFTTLAEVHPAWIVEHLKEESPRVIGIILRSLPSKHVRFVLERMPPMLRAQVPHMVESFAVSPEVLEIVRSRFERHFRSMPINRSAESLSFEQLYYLRGEELEELIREIGLDELSIAIGGLREGSLAAVYNRLDLKDAKRLKRHIEGEEAVSPALLRQARMTILESDGRRVGPDRMLFQIGLTALAYACELEHDELVGMLQQKLEPSAGYRFKRLVDERRLRPNAVVAQERRERILRLAAALAHAHRIDAHWTRFSSADLSPIHDDDVFASPRVEEETASSSSPQLA